MWSRALISFPFPFDRLPRRLKLVCIFFVFLFSFHVFYFRVVLEFLLSSRVYSVMPF